MESLGSCRLRTVFSNTLKTIAFICALVAQNSCAGDDVFTPAANSIDVKAGRTKHSPMLESLAFKALGSIQEESIKRNVEFCGYIVKAPDTDDMSVVGPAEGDRFGCKTPLVYKPNIILASFHSHGGLDPDAFTEIPSDIDFDAVAKDQVDAFIGTPGGRLWRLSFKNATATLLCGPLNCLVRDARASGHDLPSTLTKDQVIELQKDKPIRR
jgi:hypothetical protein